MARRLEWFVARRYLASRRRGRFLSLITVIAVAGVALGVMALITVIAVMTGLQRDLQAKIIGSNPHVYVFEQGGGFRLGAWARVADKVQQIPGVVSVEPYVVTQVGVMPRPDFLQPGTLYGIDLDSEAPAQTQIERQLRAGELSLGPTQSGLPGVLIGNRLANTLLVTPGDTLTILAGENLRYGPTGEPIFQTGHFEVTGLFTTGMYEYDTSNLYTSLEEAQQLLELPSDTVSGLAVAVADPWMARDVRNRLTTELGYPYWVEDWMNLNQSLFSALKLEKLAMTVILFLIVVVAAFNIISTLVMVVADKTREIGILKAMGMTDVSVLRIFMLQGLTIGLVGTAIGGIGGAILVWVLDRYQLIELPGDVYFIDRLPVALDPLDVVMIVAASLLISFAATLYPARQASRLLPVEAIRHE